MIADATKILKNGKEPGKDSSVEPTQQPLYVAFENFTKSIRDGAKCACDADNGYKAAVVAIKANEAINTNTRVAYTNDLFELK